MPRLGLLTSIAIAASIFMAGAGSLRAQAGIDPATAGATYVFAFPDTTVNGYDPRQETDPNLVKRDPRNDSVFVTIYSPTANSVTITGAGGYSTSFSMAQGGFQTVWLNGNPRAASPICDDIGIVSDKTFRIEAANPVIVYCFMATKFGTEAFTPQPVASWGREYYAATMPGEVIFDELPDNAGLGYKKLPKAAPAEILVVAAEDNTIVTIIPNGELDKNPPTVVTLMKDQCYQVQSHVDTNVLDAGVAQADLGGSLIVASQPIGVISGNTRAEALDNSAGLTKNSYKNMMIEWMAPTEQHGTEFVYLPTMDKWYLPNPPGNVDPDSRRPGEIVRVYATAGSPRDLQPTATSGLDLEGATGKTVGSFTIDRAQFFPDLISVTAPHRIRTDKPAEAFMTTTAAVKFNGTTGAGSTSGASFSAAATYMVEMTPREQWPSVAPYVAPPHPTGLSHYLNIATDSSSRGRITINGKPLVIDQPIAGTDLYWTSISLNDGETGLIRGEDSTCRFYAFVYGGKTGIENYTPTEVDRTYQENIGFMYGYPLAPAHRQLRQPDTLSIDSLQLSGVAASGNVAGYAFGAIEPNPSSTSMRISFTLGRSGSTTIAIYDRAGKRVDSLLDSDLDAGRHTISWDVAGVAPGVYYCRIRSGRWSITRPLSVVR